MSSARRAVRGGLVLAGVFTCAAVLTTQVRWLRAGSPWQDDPYDAIVSFTQLMVPALAALTFVRVLIRRTAANPAVRVAQLLRASALSLAMIGLTVVADWVGLALRADHARWSSRTPFLVAGLAVVTLATAGQATWLARATRETSWREADLGGDWLADLALAVPRLLPSRRADVLRRHVPGLAALAAGVLSTLVTGALAIGERWTDPVLIGWAFVVQASSYFAFCLVANWLLVLARPIGRVRRAAEVAAVSGALAVGVAVALRDPIARVVEGHAVDTVGQLVVLTLGAGLAVAATAYPIARHRLPR